ncbi:MAG: hypothetical protein ACT4PI_13770 [Actinomycetota bacterium]
MARLMPEPLRVTPTTLATLQQAATTLVQRKTPPPRPRRCSGWRSPRQVDEYYATIAEHWFGVPPARSSPPAVPLTGVLL